MNDAIIHDAVGRANGEAVSLGPPAAGGMPERVVGRMLEEEVYVIGAGRVRVGAVRVGAGEGLVDGDEVPMRAGCTVRHERNEE